ncbi:unnamed protein product [Cyprideis torosa]|uniref:Phospholipid scramblase n=1 Tax=Cyprideis torosa TaxID=163714 RepID=A0A7R8ZRS2_9CRUS|nr:unnamed protein product [Cyprideis torosa]CAG0899734.1 unnamed protein product [Cyprideis torosa]
MSERNLEVRASGQVMGSVVQNWSVFFPDFSIKDAAGNTVLKIEGPFCTCSCCGDVDFEDRNVDFEVKEIDFELTEVDFEVKEVDFYVKNFDFEVKNMSGQKVGKISKQWSGLVKEAFTDADTFGVSFPMDLDVRTKATLMGAVFLIDFMFFEKVGDSNDKPGMWQ